MNKLNFLKNKKIAILGLGIENQAMLEFLLSKKLDCEIVICDFRNEEQLGERYKKFKNLKNIDWNLGVDFNKYLEIFDIMFRSPGWPIMCPGVQRALKNGVELHSPMKLFFELSPTKNIIGVTGTKGKGTTTSLIYKILKADKRRVFIGGNIGEAPFGFFPKLRKNDWVVLELSSFQLEDMSTSPRIAVFTNFTKDHLAPADPSNPNYHKSMREYWRAKINIFLHQNNNGVFIANKRLETRISNFEFKENKKVIYFEKIEMKSKLAGEHNKENVGAAAEVAKLLRIKKAIVKKVVEKYKGLPYRIEFIKKVNNVEYYNDSFATTPEATIIGLKSFDSQIVLIAGGADKGSDFSILAKEIKKRVKFVVIFKGAGGNRLRSELKKIKYSKDNMIGADSMKEAFLRFKTKIKSGDIVLMSTACASFGVFKNYKERGKLFNEEVNKL
jgi:UDP-N-acetylmuramoylalanine--D-glutamate ligase